MLNPDYVPVTLDQCVKTLIESLSPEEKKEMKSANDYTTYHDNLGRLIRNEWSMWIEGSPLRKWFKENYELNHADDISCLIIQCTINDLKKKPRKIKELVKYCNDHWKMMENKK